MTETLKAQIEKRLALKCCECVGPGVCWGERVNRDVFFCDMEREEDRTLLKAALEALLLTEGAEREIAALKQENGELRRAEGSRDSGSA